MAKGKAYGFSDTDVKRIMRAVEFVESFKRQQSMRRARMPATAEGANYVYGTLQDELLIFGTATLELEVPLDDETDTVQVYGRWFTADAGDYVGATYDPFTERWDADRKACPETPDSDDADGGDPTGGGDTQDGGTPSTPSGDLDGGTP